MFDRFYRVHRGDAATEGAGLALAIATAVALLHGGRIHAVIRAAGGCEVAVKLPLLLIRQTSRLKEL
ncbi:MAG: ATP-binding protein [Planctomycetota bacterium]